VEYSCKKNLIDLHKYFLIPVIIFFLFISIFVFYLQYIYDDWKFGFISDNKEIFIPDICNDESDLKIISHLEDHVEGRSFIDNIDKSSNHQFHAVYLLPCEEEDRKFDVNKNIQFSLNTINEWFLDRTKDQIISYDKTIDDKIDVTFLRANKTMKWFAEFNSIENNQADTSSKIEDLILSNANLFHNFDKKKFIVFFEGWEKTVSLFTEICGRSRYNGKVAIFYTNGKWKKSNGNNKKIFSCTIDNLNNSDSEEFGESEGTILHEILHTLGTPPKCANNLDSKNIFHVTDSKNDILYKVSGDIYLDFNNDDYYKHKIKNCFDLSKSNYLIYIK